MSSVVLRFLVAVLLFVIIPKNSDGQTEVQYCVVDEQTPDDVLKDAINWACGPGGADCSKIQQGQPCYLPNTYKDHASYAFNNYYQKNKNKGASCYFNGAAMLDERNPSHDSCKFDPLS